MPNYDSQCTICGLESIVHCKLADLESFDKTSSCPVCMKGEGELKRVIKSPPVSTGGEKNKAKSLLSKTQTAKDRFISSGERDDMRHRGEKRVSSDQLAEGREAVRTGKYEGF